MSSSNFDYSKAKSDGTDLRFIDTNNVSINVKKKPTVLAMGVSWIISISSYLSSYSGYFSGYHEVSLNYWGYGNESIKGVAYSPVFIYEFPLNENIFPYLEAGIGICCISKKTIKGRDLSSPFQFEDRGGIGAKIGKQKNHDLNLRYMHYYRNGTDL